MKILVTGAGGFIGGAIVRALSLKSDHEIVATCLTKIPEISFPKTMWIQCDVVEGIPYEGDIDYIVHCAALRFFQGMPLRKFIDANLAMMENVLYFGRLAGAKGLIFTSSIDLYGEVKSDIVDEKTDSINPSVYGLSKYLCERLLQEYVSANSFSAIALRLCGVIGGGAKDVWLSRVLNRASRGEAIEIVNADHKFNNIVHQDDLIDFISLLMLHGFTGFNAFPIASALPLSVRNVVAEIIMLLNSSSQIIENSEGGSPFMISNSMAVDNFCYAPSDVITSLRKYVLNSSVNV
jgi:UDP-glucose 4-epimerase